jgi:membrane-associated phospholipid phosphatase
MGVDELLFRGINGVAGQSSLLDWIGVELAKPGNLLYPILLAAAYWAWVNWRECVIGGAMLAAVVGATDALGTQLKGLVQRPRPCVTLADVHQLLGCGGAFSFPSNHAANTASAARHFFRSSIRNQAGSAGPWWQRSGSRASTSGLIT